MSTKTSIHNLLRCLSRRDLMRAAAAFGLASLARQPALGITRTFHFAKDPFTLGVASGEPAADGFVLWTRLAPEPLQGGGMPPEKVSVSWEVADDANMRNIVQHGQEIATPEWAHAIHVEVAGLKPNRPYWYRFQAGDAVSPIGRARTAPLPDAPLDQLRFAFASCQHYEYGFYHAYDDMIRQENDLIVHLGDYIYEGPITKGRVRSHNSAEVSTLDEYRNRYALYKSDENLKAAHAHCPWIVTWDDHEFDNNYADGHSEEAGVDPVAFLERRARAYQAYYEHMPLRKAQLPSGPNLQLYRRVDYGNLVQFHVLDTRQYRSPQPCHDGNKPPCEGVFSKESTMLGATQESWLMEGLSQSQTKWNVLAQQVMFGRVDRNPLEGIAWSMDQWAGYDVPRTRLLSSLQQRKLYNVIVLTGDIHSNWVNDLKPNFDDTSAPAVATEFVGTSISSGGDGVEARSDNAGVLRDNPFVKFYNSERGYVRCTIAKEQWTSDYRVLPTVTQPTYQALTRAKFVVHPNRPGAERA
jgi:alkaline phosphatase D